MKKSNLFVISISALLLLTSASSASAVTYAGDGGGGDISYNSTSNDYGSNVDLARAAVGAMSAAAAGELGTVVNLTARAVISITVPTVLAFFGF